MTEPLPLVIAQWDRTSSDVVRVQLSKYNGTKLIEARIYWQDAQGEYRPSRKGISLGIKHLPALVRALGEAEGKAHSLGLLKG